MANTLAKLPRPIAVEPMHGYLLKVTFNNGETRQFDVAPYLDYPAFQVLKQGSLFMQARVAHRTVIWNDEVDIAPESLYLESVALQQVAPCNSSLGAGQTPCRMNTYGKEAQMTPDVVNVVATPDFSLLAEFATGERRRFDMKPYLDAPAFAALKDPGMFMRAHVERGTVAWNDEIDLSPDTLYLRGQEHS